MFADQVQNVQEKVNIGCPGSNIFRVNFHGSACPINVSKGKMSILSYIFPATPPSFEEEILHVMPLKSTL